jgi:hypothetical protein
MCLNEIKTVAEILALVAAAIFFVYKLVDGWGLVNLSIELNAVRKAGGDSDIVAITLKLKKGDSGSLELHTVELTCEVVNSTSEIFRIPLIYRLRLRADANLNADETRVYWDIPHEAHPQIHLPPGESTQYSHMFSVPSGAPCSVQAIVVGKRPVSTKPGQWRASIAVP